MNDPKRPYQDCLASANVEKNRICAILIKPYQDLETIL